MKFNVKRFVGVLLFWVGVVVILNSFSFGSNITGFAINTMTWKIGFSLFGLLVLVGGIVLFMMAGREVKEGNLAQQVKDSGAIILKTSKLKSIARKMYTIKNVKEGTQVLDANGRPITVIPNHRTVTPGVYRSIIGALASGHSSFRRYATS